MDDGERLYCIHEWCDAYGVIRNILDDVQQDMDLCEEYLYHVRLILNELINNGFMHGHAGNGQDVDVSMEVNPECQYIIIVVDDHGKGFCSGNGTHTIDIPPVTAERGRGLMLVQMLSTSMHLEEHGRRIRVMLYFGA